MLPQSAQPGRHSCSRSPGCVMASKQFFTFGITAMILFVALLVDSAMAWKGRRRPYSWTSFWSSKDCVGFCGDDMLYGHVNVNSAERIVDFLELGVLLVITAINTRMRDLNGCLHFTAIILKRSRPSVFIIDSEISRKNLRKPMISGCLDDSESRHNLTSIENQRFSPYKPYSSFCCMYVSYEES